MIKWVFVLVLLLSLTVVPVASDNLLAEIDEVVIRQVETSALFGNVGVALGLYWPMTTITELNVTVGPMGAIGNEAMVGGVGAQLPVSITVVGVELPVDFGFAGVAYYFGEGDWGFAGGVGNTFEVEF